MTLTPRDRILFETLNRFGFLSTTQVGRLVFSNTNLATVRRRLRILEQARLIFRFHGKDNGGACWANSPRASAAIGINHTIQRINRNSVEHDVLLNDVRTRLEGSGIASQWAPQHLLKQRAGRDARTDVAVPDALFSVQAQGSRRIVGLELELTAKSTRRYEKILTRYLRMKQLWAVWYLVRTEVHGKALESIWGRLNRCKRNDLLIWSLADDVLQNPANALVRSEFLKLPVRQLIQAQGAPPPAPRQSTQSYPTVATNAASAS